ncbi:MAG: tetratricopeptide repeat protein [Solirubrobacterales bacterium]
MKKKLSALLAIIMLVMLAGCSSAPKGDPSQVISSYYEKVKNGDAEGAYDLLAEASKKSFTKDEFKIWQSLQTEVNPLKSYKVEKISEKKDAELEGVKYKNVVEFNITETDFSAYDNKEVNLNYKRNVVNDNGVWKVYREKEDGKKAIADDYNSLAYLYIEGKGGKTKDLNKAATILNDGIKISQDYAQIYYTLASVYDDLGRYDEALNSINTYISKETDNKGKSDGYNVLGSIYIGKHDLNDAKAAYSKALELNPDNQYAKTNLSKLN